MINIEEQRVTLSKIGEEMLSLCQSQVEKSFEAFITFDTDIAEEVILKENRINALDLKIERDTDHFIALNNPVATDLRFALALLKINYNLERIGDQAFDIANHTIDLNQKLAPELVETRAYPHRPFQGWRYLPENDAPQDAGGVIGQSDALPAPMKEELRSLGLL